MNSSDRARIIHGCLVVFAAAILGRSAQVQLWQGGSWADTASKKHFASRPIPAPRGLILDAFGTSLVDNHDRFTLSIAPEQIRRGADKRDKFRDDRKKISAALTKLGLSAPWRARAFDRRSEGVDFPGTYSASQLAGLDTLRGVYVRQRTVERVYSVTGAARKLVGNVNTDGVALDGIEKSLDAWLRGTNGMDTLARTARGRRYDTPSKHDAAAQPGNTVVLTIQRDLQSIVERELAGAVERLGASGGDIVVMDPRSGEIAAMASYTTDGEYSAAAPLTVPYEPGSTVKPFTASRLLSLGRAKPDEVIDTYNGTYTVAGRTITDDHPAPRYSLRDVIRLSSNIGITRFAERFTPREEYELYRDFGFGTPTGLEYSSESSGSLRPPITWTKQSPASLAMGYELSVTSVQLATAYASIANGGELLEPTLIKEVRSPDGDVLYSHERRVVRRVMDASVATEVRKMLRGVVETGTAMGTDFDAALPMGGKTGTARLNRNGRYAEGEYVASFVGLFPVDNPEYVVLVKLVNPEGDFGGRTAAPVVKVVLQAAYASRNAVFDPQMLLAAAERAPEARATDTKTAPAPTPKKPVTVAPAKATRAVIALNSPPTAQRRPVTPRPVPDVSGMTMRAAVRELHDAGFNVRIASGERSGTVPQAGALGQPGIRCSADHPAVTPVRVARIIAALESEGLLIGTHGTLPEQVTGISDDSRSVVPGGLFIAVRGVAQDGHAFLSMATERGAALAIVEDARGATIPTLAVHDARLAAARAAAVFYDDPSQALRMIGVTGTNGKTTTVGILRHLLDATSPSASIGTLGVLRGSEGVAVPGGSGLTTPGPVEIQRLLHELGESGVRSVAMEVSSHSLDQRRADGVRFDAAVFTNLSRDHLDYHETMDRYLASKMHLAELVKASGVTVVNADDEAWGALAGPVRRITFGMRDGADVRAEDVVYGAAGSEWTIVCGGERHAVRLPLIGAFNVANALGAAAAAWATGGSLREIADRLASAPQVPGRLELLIDRPAVLRDYAHTPDALERALHALRPFTRGRLILVFGCGGDRDPGKRPIMGAIGARLADRSIITSDNPRTEDPELILDQIAAGMPAGRYERIEDRRSAIAHAMEIAREGDVVLLAGKGHETCQIRGTTKLPFDEKVIVREIAAGASA